jgi:hypothetical protein
MKRYVLSRHETLPTIGADQGLHPEEFCYLHDLPNAFLAFELSRARHHNNLGFGVKWNATNGTQQFFCSYVPLTSVAVTFTLKNAACPILSGSP